MEPYWGLEGLWRKFLFPAKKGQSHYHLCVKAAGVYYYTKCRSAERRLRSSANYIFQYKTFLTRTRMDR